MNEVVFFSCFILFVVGLLVLDLGVFHKKDHVIETKEAALWTGIWISVGILFYLFLLFKADLIHGPENIEELKALNIKYHHGLALDGASFEDGLSMYRHTMSLEYLTGYLIEKALSIDNIFVMIMIFMAFSVEKKYYHRVLFYGILGAIILRFTFIFAASALIQAVHGIFLVFGAFLIFTGIKMFVQRNKKETMDVQQHPVVKFTAKHKISTSEFHGHDFFTKLNANTLCTPLFIVLLIIEFTDIIFAFDSIPAIFSVSQDPYIVFFSNIFAILGLRSLFFLLESVMDKFYYLKIGLAVLLSFIGVKMILPFINESREIGIGISLAVVAGTLIISILTSILFPPKSSKL